MSSTPRYHVVADRGLYTCGVSDCDDGTVLVVHESKPNPLPAEQQNQQERMASEEPGAMPLQQMTTAAQTDMTDLSQVGREGRKKASGEKEREPTSTSKQEGAQEHQQEASQERDIWSAAIRDLRGSTIGIHYYGDYVGACPYHFRTAGLLAYAVCDGSIAVLLTETLWEGRFRAWAHFFGDRTPDDPLERPERTAVNAIYKGTGGALTSLQVGMLSHQLTKPSTLKMYYAHSKSVLFVAHIPYLPLAINSLRWVELSVLLKSLADPEGRMRDLHLHPFSVALLSSTFVHNYFGKLEHNATDLLPALSHLPSSPLPFPLPSLPEHHQSQAEQGRRRSRRKGESVGE
jgi:hypothetical protein